jgi:hypothetical protein
MKISLNHFIYLFMISVLGCNQPAAKQGGETPSRNTIVSIVGDQFWINGEPTFKGREWNGYKIEGLIPNSRMVQGIFDDENSETVSRFAYPDTGEWDPERNTNEFIAAMPSWMDHGVISFTINMQGGSPLGYGNQGWINTAFDNEGNLKPDFMNRLGRILDKADELGMIPILGLFYFGQDQNLDNDAAAINAVKNTVHWIHENGYQNIIIEIANECDNSGYEIDIIKKDRAHELIMLAQGIEKDGRRLLVSTSFNGGVVPSPNVVEVADFILFHGNGVNDPIRMIEIVETIRAMPEYKGQPIVCNEDDHYDFDQEMNNFIATTSAYASWGLFDFRRQGENFEEGFQTVPVDWTISTERKKGFFNLVKEMTGK